MLNISSKKEESPKFIGANKNTPNNNNNLWVNAVETQKVAPQKANSINIANTKQHEKTNPTTKKDNEKQEKHKNEPPSELQRILNRYNFVFIDLIKHFYA